VKADVSVYEGKQVIRRALARVPGLDGVDPNVVTISILLPSAIAAVALWNGWWLITIVAIVLRMVLATADGYIAQTFGRATRLGSYLNRFVTEVADAAMLLALVPHADPFWVAAALASGWLVNVTGVLGVAAGGSIQWTGPAGQADRLALVIAASLFAQLWGLDWTILCVLLVGLSVVTIIRRATRSISELRRT
jgi:phosphatidylglycerophosphate synthase